MFRCLRLACVLVVVTVVPAQNHGPAFLRGWRATAWELKAFKERTEELNRQWPALVRALDQYRLSFEVIDYRNGRLDTTTRRKAAARLEAEWKEYRSRFEKSQRTVEGIDRAITTLCRAAGEPE